MDFAGYTESQKQTLLELLLYGMYLDGNLSAIEDRKIGELLDTMDFRSDDARRRFLDAAYTRTRQRSSTPEGIQAIVRGLSEAYPEPDLRRRTFNLLAGMLASDSNIAEKERALLTALREEFKMRPAGG